MTSAPLLLHEESISLCKTGQNYSDATLGHYLSYFSVIIKIGGGFTKENSKKSKIV
jgi:hypothetical protein